MNKEVISDKQGITLVILFILGSTLVVCSGGEAKKDMWLANIIGILLTFPIVLIYAKLLSMFPGKDIFDISIMVLGRLLGRIVNILFIWFAIHLGALVLSNFSEFISIVGLQETPSVAPMACIMILSAWGVKAGIEVIGRWAEFFFSVLMIIIIFQELLCIQNINIVNILPVLEEGIKPVIKGALSAFAFPFAETVIFIMVFSSLKDKKSPFKSYIVGLIIGGILLTVISFINTLVLGDYIISLNYFPSYAAIKTINITEFLQRLESVLAITFLIAGFIKISMCLLGASKGISKLFNFKDYRFIVVPIALIILNVEFLVYKNMMELNRWVEQVYFYYAFIFQVILPVVIFIVAKIKLRKSSGEIRV
ncbi:endospore germination permease [Clostridium sp. SYSU_GA19001]|uniref:GerAB/ArcD/ProY family transporter n=1 Tax=Clostridium caldaquaticum TaxID=2940653 RepID=UPI0020770887|nr:endospore germination permease [Clostridium caldaquaticum]MCM8709512.1 endospore germination permease [Clostridium caldaquaticum]